MLNQNKNKSMKVTVLGSGTSQGVPMIACDCYVCKSENSKDKRLRSSIMISINGENHVVDSGPDFRQQMLRNEVKTLTSILITHEHKDHIAGLDDIRAFNFKESRHMEIFCTERVEEALKREFHYIFSAEKYPGLPLLNVNRISSDKFYLPDGFEVQPIQIMHYVMPVTGYRFGDFTYITDAKTISEIEKEKIKGTKILMVNALHQKEHISHFNLEEALQFISEINPEIAYLTHISHQFGTDEEISEMLPENVFAAYDGLTFEI
jgi:phosphoribosyl 1,2-cyclic phosphate phosphodiesterase